MSSVVHSLPRILRVSARKVIAARTRPASISSSRCVSSSSDSETPFPGPNPTSPPRPPPPTILASLPAPDPNLSAPGTSGLAPQTPFSFTPSQNELVSGLSKNIQQHHEHHFDTYRLVKLLEKKGFSREQSVDIMGGIKHMLRDRATSLHLNMLSKSDLENESYLFRAALSELRTEIAILHRNDITLLHSEIAAITRELDALNQRLREDAATMKSDIQLDMNNRKGETREDQKMIDVRIQEANNRFTIVLGDVRTDLEAVRWETIWKGFFGVIVAGFTIVSIGYLTSRKPAIEEVKSVEEVVVMGG